MPYPSSVQQVQQGDNQILVVDNPLASARISLFGAHVTSFIPKADGRERLWLSPITKFDAKTSLRGGIPVCWPWFADQFPSDEAGLRPHGFVRTQNWQLLSSKDNADGSTELELGIETDPVPGFPGRAKLSYTITVGNSLDMILCTRNTGDTSFTITGALHTYLAVPDLNQTQIEGLVGKYIDKTRGMQEFDVPSPYGFSSETDNIHLCQVPAIKVTSAGETTHVGASGHDSYVVWNPGAEEAKKVDNIPDQDYLKFLCTEAAITSPISIGPGETHVLGHSIG